MKIQYNTIYTWTHTYNHTHIDTHIRVHEYVHTFMPTSIHTYPSIHASIHKSIDTRIKGIRAKAIGVWCRSRDRTVTYLDYNICYLHKWDFRGHYKFCVMLSLIDICRSSNILLLRLGVLLRNTCLKTSWPGGCLNDSCQLPFAPSGQRRGACGSCGPETERERETDWRKWKPDY